jgi:hypothetical protein
MCLVVLCMGACAGDGDDVDLSSRDPRCVSACSAPEPPYEGIGAVCDAASRVQCLDECEARIANVTPICQTCLVEDADFGTDGEGAGGYCTNNTCTLTSEFGSCTYTSGDQAAELRCRQQVDPRREVSCTASFRPATECASVCS